MPHPAEQQADQRQNDDLRGERFGRGHADLRAGVHVNAAVALARDGAGDVVANAEGAIALALAFAQRAERVGGFAALADGEDERVARHRRIAVAELAGVFDFGRNVGELLDEVFADHRRVQRGAAAGENDAADVAQLAPASCSGRRAWRCILRGLSRPRIASRTESGCSKISLSM